MSCFADETERSPGKREGTAEKGQDRIRAVSLPDAALPGTGGL